MYKFLRESMFSFLLGVDLGSRIAGSCGNSVHPWVSACLFLLIRPDIQAQTYSALDPETVLGRCGAV